MIRLDWSSALEAGADELRAVEDSQGALIRYQQALVVLAEAPCPDEDPAGGSSSMADQWTRARQRIENKKTEGAPTWQRPEDPDESGSPTEELDELTRLAQQQRQLAEERRSESSGGKDGQRTW